MPDFSAYFRNDAAAASIYVPNLIAAAVILLVGLAIGWIASRIVTSGLTRAGFDALGARTGLD
ncbi:MAG: hypothetical protein IAI50_15635, partial [Candidatus Eremiobacteraeota bacterium]|nr:hypothetical protein [Candidatus Eremiobacteraeota bacterium]